MTTTELPDWAPVAFWDARLPEWTSWFQPERVDWSERYIPDASVTYRVEFYEADTGPFMVAFRYSTPLRFYVGTEIPVVADPAVEKLYFFPPSHLLEMGSEGEIDAGPAPEWIDSGTAG